MKITNFSVRGLHGYIDADLEFNKGVNFLAGPNGIGKTSIINLLEHLLTPSISRLALTDYRECSCELVTKGNIVKIRSLKVGSGFEIGVSGVPEKFSFDDVKNDAWDVLYQDRERYEEYSEYLQIKYSSNPVIDYIAGIDAPLILGIDRQGGSGFGVIDYYTQSNSKKRNIEKARRIFGASLGASLDDARRLVKDAYRRAVKNEENKKSILVKNIISSSFFYTDDISYAYQDWIDAGKREKILGKKKEILSALEASGLAGVNVKEDIDKFFEKISSIFSRMPLKYDVEFSSENPSLFAEWIINREQITRLLSVVENLERMEESKSKFFSPIDRFLETVNSFLSETKKIIKIDPVGNIFFSRLENKSQNLPLDFLSSGEKQLLIIFSHAIFEQYTRRNGLIVIDEPELSMHLGWQSEFVDRLLSVCPDMQIVLSTHSPEIVGDYWDCILEIGEK